MIRIFLLCLLLFSSSAEAIILGQSKVTGTGGDSCTGNLLYSHHAENNNDATVSANGTQGCSASETYKSWTVTSATYNNTSGYYADGAYGLTSNGYNHRTAITTTGWMDLTDTGCVSTWFRGDGATDAYVFSIDVDATHFIFGYYYFSTGNIRLNYRDGTANTYVQASAAIPANGGWAQFGWDHSTNTLQVRGCDDAACSGESWTVKTDVEIISIGTMPSVVTINGKSGVTNRGTVDNVKIYSSSNCQ